jgi:RimJ/RimL family protein N-acetyltransferase
VSEIRLVSLEASHMEEIATWLEDPDVLAFTRVPDPVPPGFAETWYEGYAKGRRDRTRDAFAVVGASSELLGVALAPRLDATTRTGELGYLVAPSARGRGVARAALSQLTDWAFTEHDLVRIELLISVGNEPSKRVAARCGYRFEGVLRSLYFKQGMHEDTEIWSRVASDR